MRYSVKTFGCRLNRAESVRFEAAFQAAGWEGVPFGAPSDVIVLHTCAVTAAAESECLRAARSARAGHPGALLAVSGCAVETSGAAERLAAAGADLVVPRGEKARLPALVFARLGLAPPPGPPPTPSGTRRALLKVQDGCSFFCTYCIVPHTRGAPSSRPLETCLDEAAAFIRAGFRELVVTGCNLACYADRGRRLDDLLAALADLPGIGRIRIGSLEPGMNEAVIARRIASSPHFCAFLHLPVQSGDDGVLRRMGRHYTADGLRRALDEICGLLPDIGLGADVIAGFPGETDEAFENTLRLVREYPFSNLHVFPYSERPGTPAAAFGGAVPAAVRKARAAELIRLREEKRPAFARRFIGRPVEVLVERVSADGAARGWTGEYLPCEISGLPAPAAGALVAVRPRAARGETLEAGPPTG